MKKLSITPITNSAQFFPKKGTLEFLQLAFQEGFDGIVQSLIGPTYNPATMYVLNGVINTGTYPVYTVSGGMVFYAGEFFLIDAASFTATGTDVAVFSIVQTQYTTDADPCVFSDATTHNIHNIRKMQLTAGASGSGLANLSSAFYLNFTIPAQVNISASGQAIASGSYPNINIDVPNSTNLNPALASGSVNVGNLVAGGADFTVTFGTPLLTSNYIVMGSMISNGTPDDDATVLWNIRSRTTTNFIVHFREDATVTQNVAWEWIAFAK